MGSVGVRKWKAGREGVRGCEDGRDRRRRGHDEEEGEEEEEAEVETTTSVTVQLAMQWQEGMSTYDILTNDDLSLELLGRVSVRTINLSYQQRSMNPEPTYHDFGDQSCLLQFLRTCLDVFCLVIWSLGRTPQDDMCRVVAGCLDDGG